MLKLNILRAVITLSALAVTMGMGSCAGKSARNADTETPPAEAPSVEAPDFNADSAYSHIKRQVEFGPRVPGTPTHAAAADYIARSLRSCGADTLMEQRATVTDGLGNPMAIRNIFARFNTSAPSRILLVAHYDTRPWADAESDESLHNTPIPGANDGASGVGVLLEIARLIQSRPAAIGVDILMVDGEDSGLHDSPDEDTWCLGTQYWVQHMPYSGSDRPRYAVLLDMVGGTGARFHREPISDHAARQVVDKVWNAAARAGYGQVFVNQPGSPVIDDHLYLNRAGIPAIDIIEAVSTSTGTFPPTWHTLSDDLRHISTSSLKAAGQTVTNVIYSEKP